MKRNRLPLQSSVFKNSILNLPVSLVILVVLQSSGKLFGTPRTCRNSSWKTTQHFFATCITSSSMFVPFISLSTRLIQCTTIPCCPATLSSTQYFAVTDLTSFRFHHLYMMQSTCVSYPCSFKSPSVLGSSRRQYWCILPFSIWTFTLTLTLTPMANIEVPAHLTC